MDDLRYSLAEEQNARDLQNARINRLERALHALLDHPGSLFAGSAKARDILNSEA